MRPEIGFVFRLGQALGSMPFSVEAGENGVARISFRWLSRRTLAFLLVVSFSQAGAWFTLLGLVGALRRWGGAEALLLAPWLASHSATAAAQFSTLARRRQIVAYVNAGAEEWRRVRGDPRRSVTKGAWVVHALWMGQVLVANAAACALINWRQPGLPVFVSSVACPDDGGGGIGNGTAADGRLAGDVPCPRATVAVSMAAQVVWLVNAYFAVLATDVLPVIGAMVTANDFKVTVEQLLEHARDVTWAKPGRLQCGNKIGSLKRKSVDEDDVGDRIKAVRSAMSAHLEHQKYLRMFNPTFAPFILACIAQIFAMCIAIFFGVILAYRTGDLINILLYLGTGLQYLFRGSLVFTAFGNVRSEADRMKSALLLDLGAATDLPARDPGLAREVELFLRVLEDAYVQAGPYLSCTHGFLFSFYGILATYIAILYQSF